MRSHLEELVAAVSVLTGHDAIDSMRLAGLGNSEGTLHVLHYITSQQDVPFAGVVLAAPPGRSVGEVLLTQLAQQAAQIPGGTELMPEVEAAAARYERGEPMDLDPRLPDSVKMVLASFESPANLPLARELWVESAADELPNVDIPTLILIGRRVCRSTPPLTASRLSRLRLGRKTSPSPTRRTPTTSSRRTPALPLSRLRRPGTATTRTALIWTRRL
jgi:pimeloyl-ACP methyl ester carboxylesterase